MTNALPLSSRIYNRLLVLYPEDLRREFGADMALVFADDLDSARREAGLRGVIRVWRCALGEFFRFALPGFASSPAVRVSGISLALFTAMMSGVMTLALSQSLKPPTLVYAIRVALLMPLFSTPLIFLVSVCVCRGSAVVSLDWSDNSGQGH
jgi:hypothetical protein